MTEPAARVGDLIGCSLPQAPPTGILHAPAPGLPIVPLGATTVLVGGMPAARLGDASLCASPAPTPNHIISASRTVLIERKAAARKGDKAAHGENIRTGEPTVLIGDVGLAFSPDLWNDYKDCDDPTFGSPDPLFPEGMIQLSTNCYAYAVDSPFDHPYLQKPQPGNAAGVPMTANTVAELQSAAVADGMIRAPGSGVPPPREGYYIVAGVVDPGVDYHWYRQDSNGTWSHKPGFCQVQVKDASGNPIVNPETADRDYSSMGVNYSEFAGYFYVPNGGLNVK